KVKTWRKRPSNASTKRRIAGRSRRLVCARARPAENALPAPVSTTARASDRSASESASPASARKSSPIALPRPQAMRKTAPPPTNDASIGIVSLRPDGAPAGPAPQHESRLTHETPGDTRIDPPRPRMTTKPVTEPAQGTRPTPAQAEHLELYRKMQ